ncbi:hypothetical protein EDC04DRAFT_2597662 [Pisolithus marmoratus]|nr:hypothetical protein EDC04DRAFT_2597662 [Pisolithus marmoratus]
MPSPTIHAITHAPCISPKTPFDCAGCSCTMSDGDPSSTLYLASPLLVWGVKSMLLSISWLHMLLWLATRDLMVKSMLAGSMPPYLGCFSDVGAMSHPDLIVHFLLEHLSLSGGGPLLGLDKDFLPLGTLNSLLVLVVITDENSYHLSKVSQLKFYVVQGLSYQGPYIITPDSMMNPSPVTDQPLSVLVHHTLSSVLGGSRLSASVVLQRSDLQKPRLRVRSQLTNLQRHMAEELLPPASISSSELKLTALVIFHAILNPYKTKYFPYPQWGYISDPATFLDVHGRVLVWYLLGIMPPARVECLNEIHLPLKDSLVKCSKAGTTFQQAHNVIPHVLWEHFWRLIDPQRLEDKVYESSPLKKQVVRQWLKDISYAEEFWNTIADIVLPDLAQVGRDAISAKADWVITQSPCPIRWPSIYLGIDVIVNQEAPPHLDQASAPSLLNLVPGTMVFLAGKLLTHSVPKWEKGERIALAHYMKDAVHNRFGLARPAFTQQKHLLGKFSQT